MDDVELVPLGEEPGAEETALGLVGPEADAVLERMGLPTLTEPMTGTREEWNGLDLRILRGYGALAPRYEIWTPAAGLTLLWRAFSTVGASQVGAEAVEAFRIAEGIPVYGIDMVEKDLPQETSQTRALHFNKGCYLGQEIVERIRSRGNVHRHLRGLELEGPVPEPGTELTLDGEPAGQITSAAELKLASGARVFALGMIRGEAEARDEALSYNTGAGAGTARILAAPPKLN
jgi:folate-binding protein YgfZ